MLNIGPLELMVILVIALLVVGPRRLPEVGRSIGRGIREFRKAQDEVQKTIQSALNEPASTARSVPRADAAPQSQGRDPAQPARGPGPRGRRRPVHGGVGRSSSIADEADPRTTSTSPPRPRGNDDPRRAPRGAAAPAVPRPGGHRLGLGHRVVPVWAGPSTAPEPLLRH